MDPQHKITFERHQNPGHEIRHTHHNESTQPGVFFLVSRRVTITYGPYLSLGIMDYRTERLDGLKTDYLGVLADAGAEVSVAPSYHLNEVRIWHLERLIYRCKLNELMYGGDGALDELCSEAKTAFSSSIERAYFNLKHRYELEKCLLTTCPCHDELRDNESLARLTCPKNNNKGEETKFKVFRDPQENSDEI